MARTLALQILVPDSASDESVRLAETRAREAAILVLQQQGELTIREAAAELALSYGEYLDLLTERNLPASQESVETAGYESIRRELSRPGAA